MDDTRAQVALLVDFENLVYGLEEIHGEAFPEKLEPELLLKLAEEYGQVVLANAYADWRFRDVNQFQVDLYRLGIDLIHVFAKQRGSKFKNAVDVKMAVDAIETIWTLPHVQTFVIVSGDRDFIHVLKTLRRYGKGVIGVSPAKSTSDDFAALCDRFVRYRALAATYREETRIVTPVQSNSDNLESVRRALREILNSRRDGVKGAQIKPLLRRKLSVTFDESEYGFSRLSELLLALPDTVRVVFQPNGSDIMVFPADTEVVFAEQPDHQELSRENLLIRKSGINNYRYTIDPAKRRKILNAFYEVMQRKELFTLNEVFDMMLDEYEELQFTISFLSSYHSVLWQSRAFKVEPDQKDRPTRQRLMRLEQSIQSADDLVYRYEASIAYKLNVAAADLNESIDAPTLCQILGLEKTDANYQYCKDLLEYIAT